MNGKFWRKISAVVLISAIISSFGLQIPVKAQKDDYSGDISQQSPTAVLTVTKTADTSDGVCDADCSLREAVAAAALGDTVNFAPSVTGTITLSLGEILIDKDLTIQGPGANLLSISAPGGSNVFNINGLFTVMISGLAITGCNSCNNPILNTSGNLTISNMEISNNLVTLGSIRNVGGTVSILFSTISGNNTVAATGGLLNSSGTMNVINSTISGNQSFGIRFITGALNVSSSTVTLNTAEGISAQGISGSITVRNSIVAANLGASNVNTGNLAVNSQGYNLIGSTINAPGFTAIGDLVGIPTAPINPHLAPLANNGGTTQTHAPLWNSLAIDNGNSGLATDQRGTMRSFNDPSIPPATGGDNSDIGAVEYDTSVFLPTVLVTKTADSDDGVCDADCSLREAVAAAQSGDIIGFLPSVTGTSNLTLFDPSTSNTGINLTKDLYIQGPGANILALSGNNDKRIFRVNPGISLKLAGLTLRDVNVPVSGGGILNLSAPTTDFSVLTVYNSSITSCTAVSGAGIATNSGRRLLVVNSTISGNTAFGNNGGGISSSAATTITVVNSTISGNHADAGNGGGISGGDLTFANSTVTGNTSSNSGGGVSPTNFVSIQNTIIAGNLAAVSNPDVNSSSAVNSLGYNLIGDVGTTTGFTAIGDQVGNSSSPINPMLAPLASNGGQTQTHALMPNSPAIDKGGAGTISVINDQREMTRPFDNPMIANAPGGNGSDIGALEIQAPTAASVSVSGRVLSSDNRAIGRAIITLTDSSGGVRTAISNQFGYFRFKEVEVGQTYILTVSAKQYQFTGQVLQVFDEINDLRIIASP